MDNTYNGWTNRETWLVGLWFNPETKSDIDYIEEILEQRFIDILHRGTGHKGNAGYTGFFLDMIDFNCINWDELREAQEDEEE
tara:strand:+ start:639 stop:887 length:249 start_codon:yes stop_codon:yes gene_type:complete